MIFPLAMTHVWKLYFFSCFFGDLHSNNYTCYHCIYIYIYMPVPIMIIRASSPGNSSATNQWLHLASHITSLEITNGYIYIYIHVTCMD